MTEDPYRWLEAISNRREYIRTQLQGGSPVLAASLTEGILLLAVGTGQSKIFEVFDRQALGGLGHPADLERIRQSVIDAAHLEAFTRAPEDVALRRLVGHGLGPQLKTAFEQIFAPPFLVRLLLAEVSPTPAHDLLVKVGFDGSYTLQSGGVAVVADHAEREAASEARLTTRLSADVDVPAAARSLLAEWLALQTQDLDDAAAPDPTGDPARLSELLQGRTLELALLRRHPQPTARYQTLDPAHLGLLQADPQTPRP